MAELTRHEFLLKKDAQYRQGYVAEVVIRMARLVEVLAARQGITIAATGEVEGLTEEESQQLSAFVPAVNISAVRESRPVGDTVISSEVTPLDPYIAVPDPNAQFGSEKVDENNPLQGQAYVSYHPEPAPEVEAEAETEDEDEAEAEPDDRTVEDLKEELREKGLPTGGAKADLIARLQKDAEENGE